MDKGLLEKSLGVMRRILRRIPLVCIVVIIAGGFICAQSDVNVKSTSEQPAKLLWVVDGIALTDSVFDYSLDQMKSDSANFLVALSLKCINPMSDIGAINVYDSITAANKGFNGYDGLVEIQTLIKKPIIVVVNGLLHYSAESVSGGDLLCDNGREDSIIAKEVRALNDYGVKEVVVIKDFGEGIYCITPKPIVAIKTEKPYYHYENMVGHYESKSGRNKYDLKLNDNLTYVFTKQDKKSILGEVMNSGIWKVENETISLLPNDDQEGWFPENYVKLDSMSIDILDMGELLIPKKVWDNKKPVKLKIKRENRD